MVAINHNRLSADLNDWRLVATKALPAGVNPYEGYRGFYLLNWPPFWMEVLWSVGRFSQRWNLDFLHCIRTVLIAGDVIVLLCLRRLLTVLEPSRSFQRLLLVGYCLNPQLMMLTVQHGNFDAFAVAWILGGIINLIQFRRSGQSVDWLCAAGCFGMGAFTKTFPLLLWPLLVCGIEKISWRNRMLGAAMLVLPAALALAPLYVLSPEKIAANVIGYRSFGASFGITGLFTLAGWDHILQSYSHGFSFAFLCTLVVLGLLLRIRPISREEDFVLLAAVILLSAFTLGPGYGAQYWFWVIPLFLICHARYPGKFRTLILWAGVIITTTNVFEYAVDGELGRFWFNWFQSESVMNFGDKMTDSPALQALIRLPMTIATLTLLSVAIAVIAKRQFSRK
jgi:hypothetical protein